MPAREYNFLCNKKSKSHRQLNNKQSTCGDLLLDNLYIQKNCKTSSNLCVHCLKVEK